jgi:hypothetical protein
MDVRVLQEVIMVRNILIFIIIGSFLLAACATLEAPAATPEPLTPAPAKTAVPPTSEPSKPVTSDSPAVLNPVARSPLDSLPGEDQMVRGNVFIDTSQVITMESQPLQIAVHLTGSLPTPCHKLRARLSPPDAQHRINLEVYSLVEPDVVCTQVLQPFDTTIPLGSFPKGQYSVMLNGKEAGQFNQQ